jgi:hypothetical protein
MVFLCHLPMWIILKLGVVRVEREIIDKQGSGIQMAKKSKQPIGQITDEQTAQIHMITFSFW